MKFTAHNSLISAVVGSIMLFMLLTGCTTSLIVGEGVSDDIYLLASHNPKKAHVELDLPCSTDCTLGTQALFLLPIGKTVAPELKKVAFDAFYESLVLAGFNPQLDSSQLAPTITIKVSKLKMKTIDLLFSRLVTTSITFQMHSNFYQLPSTSRQVHYEREKTYRLPFSREVSYELKETIREAMTKAFQPVIKQ